MVRQINMTRLDSQTFARPAELVLPSECYKVTEGLPFDGSENCLVLFLRNHHFTNPATRLLEMGDRGTVDNPLLLTTLCTVEWTERNSSLSRWTLL